MLILIAIEYFNPRSPCGERLPWSGSGAADKPFQSTLPVRGATVTGYNIEGITEFQSTLPVRGATEIGKWVQKAFEISIHAPRAGSDQWRSPALQSQIYFNPRSPCGERPTNLLRCPVRAEFQSTLPVRGATSFVSKNINISENFNPRSPCGERHTRLPHTSRNTTFQSTLPVRGATLGVDI